MPVQVFTAQRAQLSILRVYSLRLSYEYCRQLDKDKSISLGLASHCIIVRKTPLSNKTDFGYKEELKTAILKKMHFVYLDKPKDLLAFLYQHIKYLEEMLQKQQQYNNSKNSLKSEPAPKFSPLFGMLIVQNVQQYFGDSFTHRDLGTRFFIFLKFLKLLQNLMPFNSNVSFTYNYNKNQFKFQDFLTYIKSQDIACWKVGTKSLQKNGYHYQSQWTRKFYQIYQVQEDQQHQNNQQSTKRNN